MLMPLAIVHHVRRGRDLGGNPWQCRISIPCIISNSMGAGHVKYHDSSGFFFEFNVRSYSRLPDCPSNSHRRSDSEASYSPSRQLPASGRPLTAFSETAVETERVPYFPGSMGFGIAGNILTPRKVVYYSDETGDTVVDLNKPDFKSQDAAPPARRQSGQTVSLSDQSRNNARSVSYHERCTFTRAQGQQPYDRQLGTPWEGSDQV